jgi:hypothetical protein
MEKNNPILQSQANQTIQPFQQSGNNKFLYIIISILVLLLLGLGGYVFISIQNKPQVAQIPVTIQPTLSTPVQPTLSISITQEIQPTQANPNLKTFTSQKLGISFTYLLKQDKADIQEITVSENGNKVCVTYDTNDVGCTKGQSVEVFEKGKDETLENAIKRLYLAGKDPNQCFVTTYTPKNYPAGFKEAEITFPEDKEFDLEKMITKSEYCSKDYARTNGMRYFLEDTNHPTKFLFFNIGQYGISSDNDKTWQETIQIQ